MDAGLLAPKGVAESPATYSRRKTWCEGCEEYVWLWSTHGVSVLLAFWTSSALSSCGVAGLSPRMPSGPGWFCARVRTMNAWLGGTSSPVFGLPSGPTVRSGSSAFRGTNTVPPLLTVWSTPWSKNWPKKVNSELYGGDIRDEQGLVRGHTAGRDSHNGVGQRCRIWVGRAGVQAWISLGADRESG